jgi:CheY-like chemotaxis protein
VAHTLLLADDSVTIQRVIELTFADEDVQVVAVSDGEQAIARIEASPPDIILADVGMPGKSGYEVAQHVKQSPRLAHIPVLLLTGAFEPVDQARAADAGCQGVLAKPFEPQLVIGRVRELLARVVPRQPAPPAPSAPPPQAAPGLADQLFGGRTSASAAAPADLNNYFDRLDQAFASLAPPSPAATAAPVAEPDWFTPAHAPEAAPPPERWDISSPVPAVDLPLVRDETPVAFAPPFTLSETVSGASARQPPSPGDAILVSDAPPRPAPAPPPPDAAVARYAPSGPPQAAVPARQPTEAPAATTRAHDAHAAVGVAAPVRMPPLADAFAALLAAEQNAAQPLGAAAWPVAAPAADAITEDTLEEVTARVLARLPERVIREAVAEAVTAVAERLIRDEIERIKASIR